jgi:hypothetical protein
LSKGDSFRNVSNKSVKNNLILQANKMAELEYKFVNIIRKKVRLCFKGFLEWQYLCIQGHLITLIFKHFKILFCKCCVPIFEIFISELNFKQLFAKTEQMRKNNIEMHQIYIFIQSSLMEWYFASIDNFFQCFCFFIKLVITFE